MGAAGISIEAEGIIVWAVKTIARFLFGRIKKRFKPAPDQQGNVPVPNIPKDLGDPQHLPNEEHPEQEPPQEESPKPLPPTPIEDNEASWLGVKIVVLVKKKFDGLKGVLAGEAIHLASGPLKRSLRSLTDGRAEIEIVTQRESPNRFDRIARAAGVDPDPAEAIVLVPKFVKGLVKGLMAKKIVAAVSDRLPKIMVDVIFERTNGRDFGTVQAAVDSRESELLQGDPVPSKTKDEHDPVKSLIERLKAKDEQETWLQWGMASLLTLLSAGNIWDRFKKSKPTKTG